ncbi:hypothetical protein Cfor_10051, partial [Coptotermes formosanus]
MAPPASLLEDFTYHWKMVMKFYVKRDAVSKTVIESTNIPSHMDQLLKILLEEEEVSHESGTTGPCLEYLLQHNLLNLLATLACTDCPLGMRQFTLCFIRRLITQLKHPILPHVSVYGPIQRLVSLCNGRLASPTESAEIQFLCALCGLICKNPQLASVLGSQQATEERLSTSSDQGSTTYEGARPTVSETMATTETVPYSMSHSMTSHSTSPCFNSDSCSCAEACDSSVKDINKEKGVAQTGDTNTTAGSPTCNSPNACDLTPSSISSSPAQSSRSSVASGKVEKFLLLEAVLSFIHSADSRVVVKACEGLMVMASLPSDVFARSVVCHSDLCTVLTNKLKILFAAIPPDIDPNDLDDMQVNWGLDSPVWTENSQFPGCRQVAAFLAWLDYCDQFVRESHPIIGTALAGSIRLEFLERVLGPALLQPGDSNEVLITAFISKCLKKVSAPALVTGMHVSVCINRRKSACAPVDKSYYCAAECLYWLVGENREPELPGLSTCPTRQHLLNNCFHGRDEVSLETLRLFE